MTVTKIIFVAILSFLFSTYAPCLSLAPLELADYCNSSDVIALVTIVNGQLMDDGSVIYSCTSEEVYKEVLGGTARLGKRFDLQGRYYIGGKYVVFLQYDKKMRLTPSGILEGGRILQVPITGKILNKQVIEDVVSFSRDGLVELRNTGITNYGQNNGDEYVYKATDFILLVKKMCSHPK